MKQARKVVISLVAAFTLMSMAGCKSQKNDLEYVLDKGTFILGFTDFPPMGYREDGVNKGFDIALAGEVMDRLGVDLITRKIDWDAKVNELKSRRIDAIWNGLTITEERKLEVTFSAPYFNNQLVIITKAASTIESISDLANCNVGVESTSSSDQTITKNAVLLNSLKELKKYDDSAGAILALQAGLVDAVVVDEIFARYEVMAKNPGVFRVAEEGLGDELYGVGYRLGDTKLRDRIDEIIEILRQEGFLSQLSMTYFDEDLFA